MNFEVNDFKDEVDVKSDDNNSEIEQSKQEENIEQDVKFYIDMAQRIQADFANFKKRVEAEKLEQIKLSNLILVSRILPVIDDFERALNLQSEDNADNKWLQGFELILRKLKTILEEEGLKKIEAIGQEFDPNYHEAVSIEHSDQVTEGKDYVSEVLQNGYLFNGRVIRPAMVKVIIR